MNTTTIDLQARSLHDIVKYNVRALLRRYHLNRDWIIGLIGTRGAGKSLGAANIAVRDFMMNGEKCWSNMQISHTVKVPDDVAKRYGLEEGGEIVYESEYIEKKAFLALDDRYRDGILVFDEFNIEYGEARRSIANVNLMTDRAIQQLRKIQCGLIYTVLDEMYVDPRIRENTDIFIKCVDTALNAGALREHKQQGREFEWYIYPLSARYAGNGNTYAETGKKIGPLPVEMGSLWNIIDTYQRQGVGATKYGETLMPVKHSEDDETKQEKYKYYEVDNNIRLVKEAYGYMGEWIHVPIDELAVLWKCSKRGCGGKITSIGERLNKPGLEKQVFSTGKAGNRTFHLKNSLI